MITNFGKLPFGIGGLLTRSEFEKAEQVKASHILVRADPENAAEMKTAEEKANKLLERTKKEDFGKLASENSDDPGSKAKKGDLGFFGKGMMVKEFDDVVFTLPVGKVSGVIKTQFGFHIVKVTDKKAAIKTPDLEAHRKVGRSLIAEEKMVAAKKSIEEQLAGMNPQTDSAKLNAAMEQNRLKWTATEFFDLSAESIPGITSTELFNSSLELGPKKLFTNKFIQEGDSYYVARYVDSKFEMATEAKPVPENVVGNQRASSGMDQWAQKFRDKSNIEVNANITTR